MTGPQPDARDVPDEDPWKPPRRRPLRMVGLTLLMVALGIAPALALMATDPLGGQSEVPPESPSPVADPTASPLPPDEPAAKVPRPTEPDPGTPPPSARPVVDLEWPEQRPDGVTDPAQSAPVAPWTSPAPAEAEAPEDPRPHDHQGHAGRHGAGPAPTPEPTTRRCLLVVCVG